MQYLVSRKRIIKGMYDVLDVNSYNIILNEFKKFICEPDTVCCYNNENYGEGLKFIKYFRKFMPCETFEEYAKGIYKFIETHEMFKNRTDIITLISSPPMPNPIYCDIINGFDKILTCEISYDPNLYIRFIIEDKKIEAPSLLEKASIVNRTNTSRMNDAKEIIKLLLWDLRNKNIDSTKDIEKAEQFLKDNK